MKIESGPRPETELDFEGIAFDMSATEEEKRQKLREWLAVQQQRRTATPRKRLFKLFLLIMAFVFMVPAMAFAAPAFAFLLGPTGLALFSGTTLSIVSSVLGFATATAATYLIGQWMAPKEEAISEGVRLDIATGDAVPQSAIVGTYATAGSLVYAGTFGKFGKIPNTMLVQVIAVGDLPYSALNQKGFFDDKRSDIDLANTDSVDGNNYGHRVNKFIKGDKPYLWVKFKDGTQTTQDPYLAAVFNGLGARPLDNNFIGRGRAYVIITSRFEPELFDDIPRVVLSFDGIKLYDPRKDSTNGGSGSHRYGSYNTYEFSANNKVIHYNAKRGIFYGNNEEWMWGGQGLPAFLFDNATWFAAMNACDENITLKEGGTEKAFRMGAEISFASDYGDFSETLDLCTNARTSLYGGVYKTYVGAPGASVYSFTDDDIVSTLEQTNKFVPPVDDMYNIAVAEYVEPDEKWQTKSTKVKRFATYITEDGEEREIRLNLPYITKNSRAQRVVKAALQESRRTRTHLIALGPDAFRLEPLDVISWTSTKYQYSAKKFIVGNVHPFREHGYIVVALREVDASDFSWTPLTDQDDADNITDDELVELLAAMEVTAEPISIKDNDGNGRIPAIKISWDIDDEDLTDVKWVAYQVRLLDSTDDDIPGGQTLFSKGKVIFSEGIIRQEFYQVRVMPVLYSEGPTDWGDWIDVQAPNTGSDNDEVPPALTSDPTLTFKTKIDKDGKMRRIMKVHLDVTGRNDKERYRIRVLDTTEDPDELDNFTTDEFPYPVTVLAEHTYVVRVAPVSRYGVVGPISNPATPSGFSFPIPRKSAGNVPTVGVVTITTGHKKNAIEFPEVDKDAWPDYKETEIQRDSTSSFTTPKKIFIRSNAWTDGNLGNADNKFYRVRHIDEDGNPGTWSSTVSSTTARLAADDLDDGAVTEVKTSNTAPSNPGGLSLSTGAADTDQDGKMDPILIASWFTPGSDVKRLAIDIYRASSSGGAYSLWDSLEIDGARTFKRITGVNTKYWYYVTIQAIGWNGKRASVSASSGVISPTKRTLNLSTGGVSCSWQAFRRKNVVKVNNAPVSNPEFGYLEIYRITSGVTATLIYSGKQDTINDINPPTNTTNYRAKIYDITQNPSSDFTSGGASGGNSGVDDIIAQDIAANEVTTVKLISSAVTKAKLAHNIVEAQDKHLGASVSDNVLIDLNVTHGDGSDNADHVVVMASFINNAGAPRTDVDVSLERQGGVTFSNMTVSLEDDGEAVIFGVIGAGSLSGSGNTTLQMRVSGAFNKRDRKILAIPVW